MKIKSSLLISLGFLISSQLAWAAESAAENKALPPVMQQLDVSLLQDFALASDGSLWVVDNGTVKHLRADGSLIKQHDNMGNGFLSRRKIAVAADGGIWLLNQSSHNIQHYTADGTLISQFGSFGDGVQFPGDIKVAADGSLWLADTGHHQLQHYRTDGSLITQFGVRGTLDGQLIYPTHIALAKDGSVWVTDGVGYISDAPWGNIETAHSYRLQHFKADGQFIAQFGQEGPGEGQFSNINDIATAADGSLWVADGTAFEHFKSDGSLLETIDSYGTGSNFAQADKIAQIEGGHLWTVSITLPRVGINSFLRQYNADGRIIAEFRNKGKCLTEYDDLQKTVYLWGVGVGAQYYDAVLQFHQGRYELMTVSVSSMDCSYYRRDTPGISIFNQATNVLDIPSVLVAGIQYKATFRYLGDQVFTLDYVGKY